MKFVIAPDKFKGSLSAFEFCDAVEEGLRMVFKEATILKMPLADGGDGTMDVVQHYIKGDKIPVMVHDPLFRPFKTSYLYSATTNIAYIEMAEASGLKLLKDEERNCMNTTSLGTGELIADALGKGAHEIILGIGGSATNDGGMGMAHALGYRFLNGDNQELKPIGRHLLDVKKIDASNLHPKLNGVKVKVACDVTNPFYGENGAAHVYAKQKGASQAEISILDQGLRNFAGIIIRQYNIDVQQVSGAGAAGGIGGGANVFLGGVLTSGIHLIKKLANFDEAIEEADWIITGEGQLDEQTLAGKTIDGVITSAALKNIPVAAFCGSVNISIKQQQKFGLAYVISIVRGVSNLQEAMDQSYDNLVHASYNFANILK